MRRILFLARAEVLHIVRDRATLAQVLVVPILQLVVLAYAATFQVRDTPVYVVDLDRTNASRGLVDRLVGSGQFAVIGASASPDRANARMLNGDATLVVTIPRRFEADLVRTGTAPVALSLNAGKGAAAGIVQGYAAQIIADYAAEVGPVLRPQDRLRRGTDSTRGPGNGRIEVSMRSWFNPGFSYPQYMVPGILVALVTLVGTLLAAQNIAREKELGTLEQLNVTPITRGQFIAGKLLPLWVLGLLELAIGLGVGWLVFDLPLRGSLVLLFVVAAVYLVAALGIGLWISTIVSTQQQAMFVTFFIVNVYFLMSGLFTPIDSMAPWVQVVSQFNPVRHFVTIARAILVKGAGPAEIATPFLILVAFAAVVLTMAVRQYSKRTV